MSQGNPTGINLAGLAVPDYVEIAYVCAPNAGAQSISANTETVVGLNSIVSDTGANVVGAISSDRFRLKPGMYDFSVKVPLNEPGASYRSVITGLFNYTDNMYVTRDSGQFGSSAYGGAGIVVFSGFFKIDAEKEFQIRISTTGSMEVSNAAYNTSFTLATANISQRATIRLKRYKDVLLQHQLRLGTSGGLYSSFAEMRYAVNTNAAGHAITADVWNVVGLNLKPFDRDNFCALSSNKFTLPAGQYELTVDSTVLITGSSGNYNHIQYRIYNESAGSVAVSPAQVGGIQVAPASNQSLVAPNMTFDGTIDISSSQTFRLEVLCNLGGNLGGIMSDTLNEANGNVITRVRIYKR